MNCPECGSQTTPDQKFCRSCGAVLQVDALGNVRKPDISRAGKMRRLGLISIFAGLGIALTGRMLFHLDLVVYIGVLMNFLGMFMIVYPTVIPPRRAKPAPGIYAEPDALTSAQPTKKLAPMSDLDFIPSVTEGTTELLRSPVTKAAEVHNKPLP